MSQEAYNKATTKARMNRWTEWTMNNAEQKTVFFFEREREW